eukprot:snap_masked-scaffold_11-processed-gene-4.31-mRNA-1 protein AED:1.00 eAED:1.00 QI:0/0/0/0/1/1/2/0/74
MISHAQGFRDAQKPPMLWKWLPLLFSSILKFVSVNSFSNLLRTCSKLVRVNMPAENVVDVEIIVELVGGFFLRA